MSIAMPIHAVLTLRKVFNDRLLKAPTSGKNKRAEIMKNKVAA